jgi:hypothetical protein
MKKSFRIIFLLFEKLESKKMRSDLLSALFSSTAVEEMKNQTNKHNSSSRKNVKSRSRSPSPNPREEDLLTMKEFQEMSFTVAARYLENRLFSMYSSRELLPRLICLSLFVFLCH